MRYAKTPLGQQAFKERSPQLNQRQRSLFILFDGHKALSDILEAVIPLGVTADDVGHLLSCNFIEQVDKSEPVQAAPVATLTETQQIDIRAFSEEERQQRYLRAMPVATKLTASLGLKGFRLNLAVEAAADLHDLLQLYPKIRDAVGRDAALPLKEILQGK